MFERFTDRARRVVVLAQEEARMLNHNYIGTEHLILGMAHEGEGIAAKVFLEFGVELDWIRAKVQEVIGQGQQAPSGNIPFTPRAKKVLELSLREALQLGHNYIGTEHLLLGLVREGEGVGMQILRMVSGLIAEADATDTPTDQVVHKATWEILGMPRAAEKTNMGYGRDIGGDELPSAAHVNEELALLTQMEEFIVAMRLHVESRAQTIAEAETAWLAEMQALGTHEAREHETTQRITDLHALATSTSVNLGTVLSDVVHLRDGLAELLPAESSGSSEAEDETGEEQGGDDPDSQ